jgi:hypothetical protein
MALRIYETILPINGIIVKATYTRVGRTHSLNAMLTWVNRELELCMGLYASTFEVYDQEDEDVITEAIYNGAIAVGATFPIYADSENLTLVCGSFDD